MVRFLYAGYLALALFIIYPMVHGFLETDVACLGGIASIDTADATRHPASDAQASQRECTSLVARAHPAAGRADGIH
ncbi:hypothetical protein [Burkholderia sp. PU8-34]